MAAQEAKSGFLVKQGGSIKTWKTRWFVLSGPTLKYYRNQDAEQLLGTIHLQHVAEVRLMDERTIGKPNAFSLPIVGGRKYILCASTEKERYQWMLAIEGAMKTATVLTSSLDSPGSEEDDERKAVGSSSDEEPDRKGGGLIAASAGKLGPDGVAVSRARPVSIAALSRVDVAKTIKLESPIEVHVRVIGGANLSSKDISGTSDPFCVVKLGSTTCKTQTMKRTLQPVWNERFILVNTISPQIPLIIEVYDEDILSAPEFMGCVIIPVANLSAQPFTAWFTLGGLKSHLGLDKDIKGEIWLEIAVKQDMSDWLVLSNAFHHQMNGMGYAHPFPLPPDQVSDLKDEYIEMPGATETLEFRIENSTAVLGDNVAVGTFYMTPYRIVFVIDAERRPIESGAGNNRARTPFIIVPVATIVAVDKVTERHKNGSHFVKTATFTLKRSVFYPIRFGFKVEIGEPLLHALETRLMWHCSNSSRVPPALQFCREHVFPLAPPGTSLPTAVIVSTVASESKPNPSVFYTTVVSGQVGSVPAMPQGAVLLTAVLTSVQDGFENLTMEPLLKDSPTTEAPTTAPKEPRKLKHIDMDARSLGYRTAVSRVDLIPEYTRLRLTGRKWRVSTINDQWGICDSYPAAIVVPATFNDEQLRKVAHFRSQGRLPSVVWCHPVRNCVLARAAQPRVGIAGNFSKEDESLLDAIRSSSTGSHLIIFDARSRLAAEGNKLRGHGTEDLNTGYKNCRMVFLGIENIHEMRSAHDRLRGMCESTLVLETNWLAQLQSTRWLEHIRLLLASAVQIVYALSDDGTSVLIHCSDGWDRTSQLTSLAQIMVDPYYRTFAGFRVLIEKEWLSFGHKFSDRLGDPLLESQRSPVFLQFIDCVWQIMQQFPDAFEFTENYLVQLLDGIHSRLFGTFLYNNEKERCANGLNSRSLCLWGHLEMRREENGFVNRIYRPSLQPQLDQIENTFTMSGTSGSIRSFGSGGAAPARSTADMASLIRTDDTIIPVCSLKVIRLWTAWFLRGDQVFLPRFMVNLMVDDLAATTEDEAEQDRGTPDPTNMITQRVMWLPNEAARRCFGCSSPFTVVRRRHHCRACGKIFCSSCVQNRVELPHLGYPQAQKVCEHCYTIQKRQQGAYGDEQMFSPDDD